MICDICAPFQVEIDLRNVQKTNASKKTTKSMSSMYRGRSPNMNVPWIFSGNFPTSKLTALMKVVSTVTFGWATEQTF